MKFLIYTYVCLDPVCIESKYVTNVVSISTIKTQKKQNLIVI